jgi:hypothetical protein
MGLTSVLPAGILHDGPLTLRRFESIDPGDFHGICSVMKIRRPKRNSTMKRALLLIIALFGYAAPPALVRIGETEQQTEARYGVPVAMVPDAAAIGVTKAYRSAGFLIAVTYVDGISQREMLSKPDRSEISRTEIEVLLGANAGGFHWGGYKQDYKPKPGIDEWRSIDNKSRVAFYNRIKHAFYVTTQHFIDREEKARDKDTAQRLRDF